MRTYRDALLTPVTRLGSWPTQMTIRLPPGTPKGLWGAMPFSFTPMIFQPLSTWNSYRPSSLTTIQYTPHLFELTHSTSRHGTMKPDKRYRLQVTETLLPRPNMSDQQCNDRHEGIKRFLLLYWQDHPLGRTPEVAMWSNLQDTGGMRGEETRGQEPHLNPEETVLKQLNREIHRLSTVLKITDLKEHMLALLDELKADHTKI